MSEYSDCLEEFASLRFFYQHEILCQKNYCLYVTARNIRLDWITHKKNKHKGKMILQRSCLLLPLFFKSVRSFEWYFHSSIHPSFEAILWLHSSSGILQLYCILLLSHPQVKITLLRVEMGGGSNFTPPQKIYQPLVAFPIFFSLVFSQTLRVTLSIKKIYFSESQIKMNTFKRRMFSNTSRIRFEGFENMTFKAISRRSCTGFWGVIIPCK